MPALVRSLAAALTLAAISAPSATPACKPNYPCYSADGIVNAASNPAEPLAPFTWVSLYGSALSYSTRGRTPNDVEPGFAGVTVLVNGLPALLSYVSPTQVNFLMPFRITAEEVTVQLGRDSAYGPPVKLKLEDCSPELFLADEQTVVAAHSEDWTVITKEAPARAGEIVILYATGLGQFADPLTDTESPAKQPNPLKRRQEFKVLLDGKPVEDKLVEYAGAAPLFIGVYQINLRLPEKPGSDPEVRIALGERVSIEGVHLTVR